MVTSLSAAAGLLVFSGHDREMVKPIEGDRPG